MDKFHDREAGNRFNDQGAYFQESLEALTDAERRDLTEEQLDKLEDESLGDWAKANGYTMDGLDSAVKERVHIMLGFSVLDFRFGFLLTLFIFFR